MNNLAYSEINHKPREYNYIGDKGMSSKKKKQELQYIFHNPNTNEKMLEHLRKVIVNIILNMHENDIWA